MHNNVLTAGSHFFASASAAAYSLVKSWQVLPPASVPPEPPLPVVSLFPPQARGIVIDSNKTKTPSRMAQEWPLASARATGEKRAMLADRMGGLMKLGWWLAFSFLALPALGGCDDADKCKTVPECTKDGKCSVDAKGVCVVSSDKDCSEAEACKLHGKCSAKDGECIAEEDSDCKKGDDCQKLAMCSAYHGACVDLARSIHAECSKTCTSEGLCVSQGGKCIALSRLHCAGTSDDKPEKESPCARLGHCTAKEGQCVAGSDDDCKLSALCKDEAACAAKDGACIASAEDCKKSNACATDGKCAAEDGKCVAASAADCKSSSRCKLEGLCSAKDGKCIALSSADCRQAAVCKNAKRCAAQDGACTAGGGSGSAGGAVAQEAPDKSRKTTISGVF